MSGYYDDHDRLARDAWNLDCDGYEVYVTLNELDPAFRERATNGLVSGPASTTSDGDVARRRWLLVDVDPVRPAGVSATMEEKTAAYHKTLGVRDHLRGREWPEPVVADSGSGFHLLYPIDLPNDGESRDLVKRVLASLARDHGDGHARVDVGVHNAARIVRLYGTVNRKGVDTPERPHRRTQICKVPEEALR